jgi:hypothetical protein
MGIIGHRMTPPMLDTIPRHVCATERCRFRHWHMSPQAVLDNKKALAMLLQG